MSDTQITTQPNPFALTTMEDAEKMAKWIAESGCFGITKPAQALTLMMISHAEGQTLAQSLKRYHVFDTGKLSQRADYTKKEFEKTGTIIWHIRTDECVVGSFFNFKPIKDEDRARAIDRFPLQYELDMMMLQPAADRDRKREAELMKGIAALSREGEITVVRTLADAEAKGITEGKNGTKTNWQSGSRAMLQWRCLTEGANVVGGGDSDGLSSDVDLQDARVVEQRLAVERQSPQDRERDAIKAMMAQHLEDADSASGERKKELLGLASELRCKLAEMEPVTVSKVAISEYDKSTETLGQERIVDATDATVHPPEQRPIEEHPDYDNLPGIETPPPKLTKWENHIITTFKVAAYKNKRLGELSKEEIEVLHKSMGKKDLPKESREVIKEAGMIAMAFEATRPASK